MNSYNVNGHEKHQKPTWVALDDNATASIIHM